MTREEQIEQKAKELGQKYFPDEYNIWARPNYEAQYVESACKEMVEWAGEHPNNPYKDVIEHMSSNTYRVWKKNLWHDAPKELPDCECVCVTHYNGGYHINVWNPYYRTWDDSEGDDCEFDNNKELDWMVLEVEEEQQ